MHTLTIGPTGSGKTTLWKLKAQALMDRGVPVLLHDPLNNDYPCHYKAKTPQALMERAKTLNHAHIIIDESGAAIGRNAEELQWFTTMARNYGHSTHLICQRAQQIDKTMRLQTERAFVFRVHSTDAKTVAEEFTRDEALAASTLDRYYFLQVDKFGGVKRFYVSPQGVREVKNGP
jgi:energy-coupling factor transporter ATP-binding protein EcfA2